MQKILQLEKVAFGDIGIFLVIKLALLGAWGTDSTTEIFKYKRKTRDKVKTLNSELGIGKIQAKI